MEMLSCRVWVMSSHRRTCNWAAEQIITITIIIIMWRIKREGENVAMRAVKNWQPHEPTSLKMTASNKAKTCSIGLLPVRV